MRLASIYFDDTVCIPGGKDVGGGLARQDLRDSAFHAADGWSIEMLRDTMYVTFRIKCEGMTEAALIGGYGYTAVPAAESPEPAQIKKALRKAVKDGKPL